LSATSTAKNFNVSRRKKIQKKGGEKSMTENPQVEKNMVLELWAARKEAEMKKAELANANERVKKAEFGIKEHMLKKELKSLRINGVGLVTLNAPKLTVRCNQSENERLFAWLDKIDRKDVIKESVHNRTLTTLVTELVDNGESIPEFINTGYIQLLSFRPAK
jgi:hypothetical protein